MQPLHKPVVVQLHCVIKKKASVSEFPLASYDAVLVPYLREPSKFFAPLQITFSLIFDISLCSSLQAALKDHPYP